MLGCQAALYEWAESYDSKDWERLARCIAPTLQVSLSPSGPAHGGASLTPPRLRRQIDYSAFLNKSWDALAAAEFVAMASDPRVLGNPRLQTQHLVGGASRWTRTGDAAMTGEHQMRVAHQKYADDARREVALKGHAHGSATVWYRRVDGVWKFAGIRPNIRWAEYDHDKIFADDAGVRDG